MSTSDGDISRDAFQIFDRDKDGFVDIKELIKVASTMGFSLDIEDLKICLDEVDEVGLVDNHQY